VQAYTLGGISLIAPAPLPAPVPVPVPVPPPAAAIPSIKNVPEPVYVAVDPVAAAQTPGIDWNFPFDLGFSAHDASQNWTVYAPIFRVSDVSITPNPAYPAYLQRQANAQNAYFSPGLSPEARLDATTALQTLSPEPEFFVTIAPANPALYGGWLPAKNNNNYATYAVDADTFVMGIKNEATNRTDFIIRRAGNVFRPVAQKNVAWNTNVDNTDLAVVLVGIATLGAAAYLAPAVAATDAAAATSVVTVESVSAVGAGAVDTVSIGAVEVAGTGAFDAGAFAATDVGLGGIGSAGTVVTTTDIAGTVLTGAGTGAFDAGAYAAQDVGLAGITSPGVVTTTTGLSGNVLAASATPMTLNGVGQTVQQGLGTIKSLTGAASALAGAVKGVGSASTRASGSSVNIQEPVTVTGTRPANLAHGYGFIVIAALAALAIYITRKS
jgi:hypothetical protein